MPVHTRKKTTHCSVTWEVNNFSVGVWKQGSYIDSLAFVANASSSTKWTLRLFPNDMHQERSRVSLHLLRVDTSNAVENVFFKCKVSIFGKEGCSSKILWEDESEFQFKCGMSFIFEGITTLGQISELCVTPFLYDIFTICCEMYISDSAGSQNSENGEIPPNFLLLSSDLKKLYENKLLCDSIVRTDNRNIEIHKAMLFARSGESLRRYNPELDIVEMLRDTEYDVVDRVVSFLYSGDPNKLLSNPTIGLYECAEEFDLPDLKQLLEPEKLHMRADIEAVSCEFKWFIENFSFCEKTSEDFIVSPPFNKGTSVWRLKLYPEGQGKYRGRVGIFAEVVEGIKTIQVLLEISLLDVDGVPLLTKTHVGTLSSNGMCGFPSFIKRDGLRKLKAVSFVDDILRIHCQVKYSTGKISSALEKHESFIKTAGLYGNSFRNLSKNMRNLLESGKFSDVCLLAEGRKFHVHRFILSARSPVFASMFSHEMEETKTGIVKIPDVDQRVLKTMLQYIYCGELGDLCLDVALGLYQAAEKYALSQLKNVCSDYIKLHLQEDSVCQVLILADLHDDSELKATAMNYVCCNAARIFRKEDWISLRENHKALALEVIESLSNGYRNSLVKKE